ncbi:MAG: MBOAT family O-acyltransferase [Bacteroidota bacterium]
MLFTSFSFFIFLPIVFVGYWLMQRQQKAQNFWVLLASYVFYGWWDWRFLSLIFFSSLIDFLVGRQLGTTEDQKKRNLLLAVSLSVNLGMLGFFKYFNFFIDSWVDMWQIMGVDMHVSSLNIILPVGISFYTFQTLSYTIDIYRRKMAPSQDPVAFFAFVSYFPQLVAGPIERATHLLPQFSRRRTFSRELALDGIGQMCWGFFKKVVIADNCAMMANEIFGQSEELSGSVLLVGAIYFAFQIYGDFSGYSDIAIGLSKLFGIDLMRNFAYPYFSRDIAEFWRRWHISLSTWFRDYLYIPLGGSRGGVRMRLRNVAAIFLVSGFWHGANWTFVIWGALHALYYLPVMLANQNRKNLGQVAEGRYLPSLREAGFMLVTFIQVLIAWVFFRAENLEHAFQYLSNMFSLSLFSWPDKTTYLPLIGILLLIEWIQRAKHHPLVISCQNWGQWSLRVTSYALIIWSIFIWGAFDKTEFIYFQF